MNNATIVQEIMKDYHNQLYTGNLNLLESFHLSIGQHGSILLQEIHLPRVTTSCICDGADVPNLDVAVSIDMLFSFTDIILLHNYKER